MNNLLDTCTLSEFTRKLPNQNVLDWFSVQPDETLFLSVITIAEVRKGIECLPNSRRRGELENWLNSIVQRFDRRILPFDLKIPKRWAAMTAALEKKGRILPSMDSLIAATALKHDLTIITRNTRDFTGMGAKVLDIWK